MITGCRSVLPGDLGCVCLSICFAIPFPRHTANNWSRRKYLEMFARRKAKDMILRRQTKAEASYIVAQFHLINEGQLLTTPIEKRCHPSLCFIFCEIDENTH